MLGRIVHMLRNDGRPFRAAPVPKRFRPELFVLEGRITPADITWVGNGMGAGANWSVAANWSANAVPGANDTAIFSGTVGVGANTPSTMDLGGVGAYHVGKLVIRNGYTNTLTLNANLYVDILDFRGEATIKASGATQGLGITQRTGGAGIPAATFFGASIWAKGTMETAWFAVYGETAHRTTLQIGDFFNTDKVTLNSNLTISDQFSTVNWLKGDVAVQGGKKVINWGSFIADSPGNTMGNNGDVKWTFENHKDLTLGAGTFRNFTMDKRAGAREFKVASASTGADQFNFAGVGTVTQEDVTNLLSIESGTLSIDGTFTQSAGDTQIADGTTLAVANGYNLSGGTLTVGAGTIATGQVAGSYNQTGGALAIDISDAGNDRLQVTGSSNTVNLAGALDLNPTWSSPPAIGTRFTIIQNDTTSPVSGTFTSLPDGTMFLVDGVWLKITYSRPPTDIWGNPQDTNDVILESMGTGSGGMIEGVAWNDLNDDGIRETGEPNLTAASVTVKLVDDQNRVVATTTTDAAGAYSFGWNVFGAGTFAVEFVAPPGGTITNPSSGRTSPFQVAVNQVVDVDVGVFGFGAGSGGSGG